MTSRKLGRAGVGGLDLAEAEGGQVGEQAGEPVYGQVVLGLLGRCLGQGSRGAGAATKQRIRATLRSALGTYIKQHPGLLDVNVTALVELLAGKRPKPLVWTDERVRAWRKEYEARLAAARASAGAPGQPAR